MLALAAALALAFVQGNVIIADGKVVAHGSWAAWSPSGKLAVERDGIIYVDGKRRVRGQTPAWSRTDELAYARDRAIWVGALRVTRPRHFWENDVLPAWSPDGTRIAFAATGTSALHSELWLVRRNGTGRRRLTKGGDDYDDGMPSWTPDGRIVFVSTRDRNRELYVLDPVTGGARRLTRTATINESLPKVSPNGKLVAFDDGLRVGVYSFATGRERFVGLGLAPAWIRR